jgi:hypothetical protein
MSVATLVSPVVVPEAAVALDDLLIDLGPSLEVLEQELLLIEARSIRTETCICTIACGKLDGVSV